MSKEVDYKKQKKQAAKEKRRAQASRLRQKEEIQKEEEELKLAKSEYDKEEHIRRKLVSDMVSKDLTEERFTRLYDKFYLEYADDYDMALFMILVRLSYDYDEKNFESMIKQSLRNIKTKESGALVKSGKSQMTNFYDTSITLELLRLIKGSPRAVEKYNKRSFLDSTGSYKIAEKFGTIEEAEKRQLKVLNKIFDDSVRLMNLWRKKVEEDIVEKKRKRYREEPYNEKELQEELENERKRYELLLELSMLLDDEEYYLFEDVSDDFFEKANELDKSNQNNKLFIELMKLQRFYDKNELRDDINKILSKYNENHNSILSLLEYIHKVKTLEDRYSSIRNIIDEGTLEQKYGPLSDFIDAKKLEFLYMDRGIKYVEEIEEDLKKTEKQPAQKEDRQAKEIGEDIEELLGEQRKAHEEYKDLVFFPLEADKDRGKGRMVKKSPKGKKEEKQVILQTLDASIKNLTKEQLDKLRMNAVYLLKKYFDQESSKEIENKIYEESKTKELRFYLTRLGKLIILVDDKSLKDVAKLLNKRLESQYYDVNDLLNLSYKELLQDVYSNPLNKDFKDLNEKIDIELNKFFKSFILAMGFIKMEKKLEEIKDIDKEFVIYNVEGIDPCNIEYKNKKIFEKYNKLKQEYEAIDESNPKEKLEALKKLKEEEKNTVRPYLKNIVYYREDDQLYCFNFWEIEENFEQNNQTNPYTGKEFSQDFIEDFKVVMTSKQKRQKRQQEKKEEEKVDYIDKSNLIRKFYQDIPKDFVLDIFSDINSKENELKNKLSKENACFYYKTYVFPSSNLEVLLNKDEKEMKELKKFCGIESENVQAPIPTISPIPTLKTLKQQSPSKLSIPSISLDTSKVKSQVNKKSEISLPLIEEDKKAEVSIIPSIIKKEKVEQIEKKEKDEKSKKMKLLELASKLEKDF